MNASDQITENEDGTITVAILREYEKPGADGEKLSAKAIDHLLAEQVESLTIGEIYGRHLIAVDGIEGTNEQVMRLASEITGVPYRVFLRMHEADLSAVAGAIARQRGKSHASGVGP